MILGLQIIAIIFSFSMVYFALLHRRRGEIDRSEFISWTIIWIIVLFTIVFPEFLRTFAKELLITRLFDLMVVGGFILVLTMVARIYVKTRRMEKKFEEYIRKEALKNVKKNER